MKKYAFIFLLCMILSLLPVSTAYAFDTPNQSTDNATDVILWPADDLTVNVDTTGIEGSIDDSSEQFFIMALTALIIGLVFWQKQSLFLRLAGVPVAIVYGLTVASVATYTLALWVDGVIIAVIGLYFLYSPALSIIQRAKR